MRLIDADKLIKRLEKWNTSDITDKALYNFAMNRVMEQPTAYDVDKVVEQLEESSRWEGFSCDEDGYSNDTEYRAIALDRAIEIVEGGGVNE